jgi:hypothetical protein
MGKTLRLNDVVLAKVKASNGSEVEMLGVVCRVDNKERKVVVRLLNAGGYYTVDTEKVTKKSWLEVI